MHARLVLSIAVAYLVAIAAVQSAAIGSTTDLAEQDITTIVPKTAEASKAVVESEARKSPELNKGEETQAVSSTPKPVAADKSDQDLPTLYLVPVQIVEEDWQNAHKSDEQSSDEKKEAAKAEETKDIVPEGTDNVHKSDEKPSDENKEAKKSEETKSIVPEGTDSSTTEASKSEE